MSSAGLVGGQNPSMGKGEPNNPEFQRPYFLCSLHQCCRPLKTEKDLGFSKRDSAVRISAQRPTHAENNFQSLVTERLPPKARWSLTVLPWRPPKASSSVSRSYNSDSFEGEWIGSTNPKCSFIYNKSSHVFILANQQKKHNLGKRH